MKAIVIGSSGQLGSDVVKVFGRDAIPLERGDVEIADIDSCRSALKGADVVINCAGFVRVDDCESSVAEAFASNSIGARNVAAVCKERGMRNVYISTDFVFDGAKGSPYKETDAPRPINAYGISKYAGELFTQAYSGNYYILRCAGMFGVQGSSGKKGNFVEWMLKKADSGDEIKVVDDIVTSFTYTVDVAGAMKQMLKLGLPPGIYHSSNTGNASWHGFASKIFELAGKGASPVAIKSSDYVRKANPPKFSALDCSKLKNAGVPLPSWEDALKRYLKERNR